METFSAVPSVRRIAIRIIDREKYEDWLNRPIEVDKDGFEINPEPIPTIVKIFLAYEKGPGTPVPVQIEVDQIDTEYQQQIPNDEDRQNLSAFAYVEKWRRITMLLRRNLLLAVLHDANRVPIDSDDANNLATESDGPGQKILERLGYLRVLETTDEDEDSDSDAENEKEGEDETGE